MYETVFKAAKIVNTVMLLKLYDMEKLQHESVQSVSNWLLKCVTNWWHPTRLTTQFPAGMVTCVCIIPNFGVFLFIVTLTL